MNKRHNYCGIIFIRGGQWSWVAKIFQVWDVNSLVGVQKTLIFINIKHMLVCIYVRWETCTVSGKGYQRTLYDNFLLWTFHSIPFKFNELIVLLLTWTIWMDMYVILLPILKCFYIFFQTLAFIGRPRGNKPLLSLYRPMWCRLTQFAWTCDFR